MKNRSRSNSLCAVSSIVFEQRLQLRSPQMGGVRGRRGQCEDVGDRLWLEEEKGSRLLREARAQRGCTATDG